MELSHLISSEFRIFVMNYAMIHNKNISDIDLNYIYKLWNNYLEKSDKKITENNFYEW